MRNNGHAKVSSVLSQRFDVVNSDFIYRLFSKQRMIIIQQGRVGGGVGVGGVNKYKHKYKN